MPNGLCIKQLGDQYPTGEVSRAAYHYPSVQTVMHQGESP